MSLETMRIFCEGIYQNAMNVYTTPVPIRFDNTGLLQPETMWVDFAVLHGRAKIVSLGTRKINRHVGFVQMAILIPQRTGTSDANLLADYSAKVFTNRKVKLSDGDWVLFEVPEIRVGATSSARGIAPQPELNFYPMLVRAPFCRDEFIPDQ